MKKSVVCLLPLFAVSGVSFAGAGGVLVTNVAQVQRSENVRPGTVRDDVDEQMEEQKPRAKRHNEAYPWYLRIQQAPLIGLAAVSDDGVLDVEVMKAVNDYFWVGPTLVLHTDKAGDTKMSSANLGVRADIVLPSFGIFGPGVYFSSALLIGSYSSKTFTQVSRTAANGSDNVDETTCDFKSRGVHRAGALVVGKQFHLSDDFHLTTGLGIVKTKVMTSSQSGFCNDKSVIRSEGRSLPWLDLGVGFRI